MKEKGRPDPHFEGTTSTAARLILKSIMKTTQVTVRWTQGLHLRPAAQIVEVARRFRSQVKLRLGSQVANATSVIHLLVLCATLNATVEIEAQGDDEQAALDAVSHCFDVADRPAD